MATTAKNVLGIESDLPTSYPSAFGNSERKLLETERDNHNVVDVFRQALVGGNFNNATGAIYTGATAEILSLDSGRATYEYYCSATASAAVVSPYVSAAGLRLRPIADADNFEFGLGTTSRSRGQHTVAGRSKAFFTEVTITEGDISGIVSLWFGWRKAEAYVADPNNYTQVAAVNVGLGANGRFNITTILDDATTSTTNTGLTGWADGETHKLRVEVDLHGVATFYVDGVQQSVAAFQFHTGEILVPFLYVDTGSDGPDTTVTSFKCGYK